MKTKLEEADIDAAITLIEFHKHGLKTTVCTLTLANGFEVVATSSCVSPENYNEAIGQQISLQRAKDKVWELEGYRLQSAIHNKKFNIEEFEK